MWNAWCELMIGGRSESHPRDPGVSIMLVSGLVKLTKKEVILLLVVYEGTKPLGRVQESIDQLGAWLLKGEY